MAIPIFQGCAAVALAVTVVIAIPPPGHVPKPIDDKNPPKYEYGYVVSDKEGNTQGHVESRDGVYALGRYYVNLPNGNEQKVTYFADDWGYHPLVSYTSTTASGSSRTEFAMGENAIAALKQPVPTVAPKLTSGLHGGIEVLSAGSSGHNPTPGITGTPIPQSTVVSTVSPLLVSQPSVSTVTAGNQLVEHVDSTAETGNRVLLETSNQISNQLVANQPAVGLTPPVFHDYASAVSYGVTPILLPAGLEHTRQQTIVQNGVTHSQNINEIRKDHIQIVTPSSVDNSEDYVSAIDNNSILANDSGASMQFNHQGQNIKITSYLADTNKILYYGARIGVKEKEDIQEQRLIDELQEHVKQRIFEDLKADRIKQDLRKVSTTPQTFTTASLRPIIVTDMGNFTNYVSTSSTPLPIQYTTPDNEGLSKSVVSYIRGESGYNSIIQTEGNSASFSMQSTTVSSPPAVSIDVIPTPQPLIDSRFATSTSSTTHLDESSNSLTEKSDYMEQHTDNIHVSAGNPVLITPRPNDVVEQLAPLQAGISLLSAPEVGYSSQTVAPVSEDNGNSGQHKTTVEIQEGISFDVQQTGSDSLSVHSQNDISQNAQPYRGLGYEQRLVNQEAQQIVRENDPLVRDQKQSSLIVKQETELEQVQRSLQDLQQKIINEIDLQHEEEERKQELAHGETYQKVNVIQEESVPVQTNIEATPQVTPIPVQSYDTVQTPTYHQESSISNIQSSNHVAQHEQVAIVYPENQGERILTEGVNNQVDYQVSTSHHQVHVENNPSYVVTPTAGALVSHYEPQIQQVEHPVPPLHQPNVQIIQNTPHQVIIENKVETQELSPPPLPPIVEVEKPVLIPKPTIVENTKIVEIEKPIVVKEPVAVEETKIVEVEKPVALLQPYPVEVTKVVHVDRPVAVPAPYAVAQPIPVPFAIPHAIGVPIPHLIPYPEIIPLPFKEYHPVYIHKHYNHQKSSIKPSIRLPDQLFKEPAKETYAQSHSYNTMPVHLKLALNKNNYKNHYPSTDHFRTQFKGYPAHSGRNKNVLKNLRIEYGFKPPFVPSAEIKEEPKPSIYGPSVKHE